MLDKFFKKNKKEYSENNDILTAALLIHAAKIDENYTDIEKKIIKKALIEINNISDEKAEELMLKAEKEEETQNQIVKFTREIKKISMDSRLKIIEVIWKIVYSDGISDSYESNLIRRICGLLYISDRDSGKIKTKIKNMKDKS